MTHLLNKVLSEGAQIRLTKKVLSKKLSVTRIEIYDHKKALSTGLNGDPSDIEIKDQLYDLIKVWYEDK